MGRHLLRHPVVMLEYLTFLFRRDCFPESITLEPGIVRLRIAAHQNRLVRHLDLPSRLLMLAEVGTQSARIIADQITGNTGSGKKRRMPPDTTEAGIDHPRLAADVGFEQGRDSPRLDQRNVRRQKEEGLQLRIEGFHPRQHGRKHAAFILVVQCPLDARPFQDRDDPFGLIADHHLDGRDTRLLEAGDRLFQNGRAADGQQRFEGPHP